MDDKYKNLTVRERVDILRNSSKDIAHSILGALKETAKNGNLTLNFENKLSPKAKATFIDSKAVVVIGNKKIQLPLFKNGHYLCRVIFN